MVKIKIRSPSHWGWNNKYELISEQNDETQTWNVDWPSNQQTCKITQGQQHLSIRVVNKTLSWCPFLLLNQSLEAHSGERLLFRIEFRKLIQVFVVFSDGDETQLKWHWPNWRRVEIVVDKIDFRFHLKRTEAEVEVRDESLLEGLCLGLILWKLKYADGS